MSDKIPPRFLTLPLEAILDPSEGLPFPYQCHWGLCWKESELPQWNPHLHSYGGSFLLTSNWLQKVSSNAGQCSFQLRNSSLNHSIASCFWGASANASSQWPFSAITLPIFCLLKALLKALSWIKKKKSGRKEKNKNWSQTHTIESSTVALLFFYYFYFFPNGSSSGWIKTVERRALLIPADYSQP